MQYAVKVANSVKIFLVNNHALVITILKDFSLIFYTSPKMWKIYFICATVILLFILFVNASDEVGMEHPYAGEAEVLPWFVSIQIRQALCGGSLIANSAVLTAAQCFRYSNKTREIFVLRGGPEVYKRETHKVKAVIIHPEFASYSKGWHNDIAVVFMEKPLDKPIQWLWQDVCPGHGVWSAGFGDIKKINATHPDAIVPYSKHVMKTSLKVISSHACRRVADKDYDYEINTLSYGSDECKGESGGPLYGYDKDIGYVLYGLISFKISCGNDRCPHVGVRLWPYMEWIYDTIMTKSQRSGVLRGS